MSTLYVGTYTADSASEGIYICEFGSDTGSVLVKEVCAGVDNPSFLAVDSQRLRLFAVNEIFEYDGVPQGSISSFSIDSTTHLIELLSRRPSHGRAPCHVAISADGRFAYLANYMDGNACAYPISQTGHLEECWKVVQHSGQGPDLSRQESAHAHSVTLSPDGRFVIVADLGIDRLISYTSGDLQQVCVTELLSGSGPRHLTFHPNGCYAYLINELNSTMTVLEFADGHLSQLQTLSTLPEGFVGDNITADVHVSPDGRFVYGTNRGHESITCFAIEEKTGRISFVECRSTCGDHPRNFVISPDGRFVLVANQNSNNVVTFARDLESGKLRYTGLRAEIPMPVCLTFLEES